MCLKFLFYLHSTLIYYNYTLFTVPNDSSRPSFGNKTSESDSKNSIVVVTAVTASVTSCVLLIIFCGVTLTALLRCRSSKDVLTDEPHTQSMGSPYYENITLPRVTYQDQEFELKDNIAYGPLPCRQEHIVHPTRGIYY